MSANSEKSDALLDKLDSLMRSGHAEDRGNPPPILVEAFQEPEQNAIPTLVDVVELQQTASSNVEAENEEQTIEDIVASRLVACVGREMAGLWNEFAAHQGKLAVLHRSIKFALPQLVRLRWEEENETEDPELTQDDIVNPDQDE